MNKRDVNIKYSSIPITTNVKAVGGPKEPPSTIVRGKSNVTTINNSLQPVNSSSNSSSVLSRRVPNTIQQNKVAPAINKGGVGDLKPATGVLKPVPVRANITARSQPATSNSNSTVVGTTNSRRNVKTVDMEQLLQQIHQLKRECQAKEEKIGSLEKKNAENEERCTYLFRQCRNYEKKLEDMGIDPVTLEQLSQMNDDKENQLLIQSMDSLSSKYTSLITQTRDQLLHLAQEMNIPKEQFQHCLEIHSPTSTNPS
jgi:hypothetical protein